HADAVVLAPPAPEASIGFAVLLRHDAYHRLVLRLWTCTCSPLPIFATVRPMSWPYFQMVSPSLMSASAILCPMGTSILEVSRNEELSAVTTHNMSVPAFRPSTTTTPTESFLSCTKRCGVSIPRPTQCSFAGLDKALRHGVNHSSPLRSGGGGTAKRW